MAALFPKIYDIIDTNPHKHSTLRWRESTSTEAFFEEWDRFQLKPLDPPGALSVLSMAKDPMYELGSVALRKQIQIETLLTLHERVDKELVGRRFPRKKIQDLLAGQISAQTPTSTPLLEEVLCELFQVQKVQINRRTKSLSFFPSDLRIWTSEKQILFSDEDNAWLFVPTSQGSFCSWLTQKESEGWTLSWPTADGKLDELKAGLMERMVLYDAKHKKDDLARMLGRAQALVSLQNISFQGYPVNLETP
jgi:hypothetical protein